jgi:hypothetical protein
MDTNLPPVLLLVSPDDFLLELESRDFELAWRRAHAAGEVITFEEAPSSARLVQELATPSLFSPHRLLLVTSAGALVAPGRRGEGDALAQALEALPLADVTLVLAAVAATAPGGALAEVVAARGQVRFLALPEPPKPWEETKVSPAQRRVLASLVARTVPALAGESEVVEALAEVHGFRPRALVQAAEQLLLGGVISAAAVRASAGAGECAIRELEESILERNGTRYARFAGVVSSRGTLTDWRGEPVAADRAPAVLAGTLGRLVRQALAVRGHALRAGLVQELQPKSCARRGWYTQVFKPRVHPVLAADIEATPASPLTGLTPWQLHRAFRLAAAYSDAELVTVLAGLAESTVERERGPAAIAALSTLVLRLIAPAA